MASWYDETFEGHTRFGLRVEATLASEQSPFQKVEVIETTRFGRVLVVDGVFMTSERDEFLYHEMLVHPALTTAPRVDRVLVVGGGDGGTVREVLRHPDVSACVMIEIDEVVVEVSKRHLPRIGTAWEDPRLDVRFQDGIDYVQSSDDDPYDVILLDGTDPVGPGAVLFDDSFFRGCKRMLRAEGVMALQSGSPLLTLGPFLETQRKLRASFTEVHPYFGPVPLYSAGVWSWTWCSDQGHPRRPLRERQARIASGCRAYNAEIHQAAFALPSYLRDARAD